MTASEILTRWGSVASVFCQPSAWLTMLHIARAGDHGITRPKLREMPGVAGCPMCTSTVKKYTAAGILRVEEFPGTRGKELRFFITEKGLRFLRLNPEPAAQQ